MTILLAEPTWLFLEVDRPYGKVTTVTKRSIDAAAAQPIMPKRPRNRNDQPGYIVDKSKRLLIIGDGDFSFSRGLIRSRKTGKNVIATSYDTIETVQSKYSNALKCISEIKKSGGIVCHGIDGTDLSTSLESYKTPPLYDYIIFNFPHSGHQRVHINRALLYDFFISAREKLLFSGEAHVTLKTKPPYSNWLIEEQAKKAGLVIKSRTPFHLKWFPGYHHRTTDPLAKKFEAQFCTCFAFVVDRSKYKVPTAISN